MAGDTLRTGGVQRFTGALPLALVSGVLLASLVMMSAATQNSALFGRLYSWLLLFNILGVVFLLALIAFNLMHLLEQWRARALGSRLTLRLLVMFALLSVLPVMVVFFFSIQTLNRGIDHWFDVRIEQALDDALALGRAALDAIKQDLLKNARDMAAEIELVSAGDRPADRRVLAALNELRERYELTELTLFAPDGKIIASSSELGPEAAGTIVPDRPSEAVLAQVRQGLTYAALDPRGGERGLRLRVATPVYGPEVGSPVRVLQALVLLPPRYTKLSNSVQTAFAEYEKLVYLRGPLKFGFTLTLSLVALFAMLVAISAAIFSARRLTAPLRDLAEGVRAVARGDYDQQLPVTSHDEIGVLVESFNDMTRRIMRAQREIQRSQQEAERARAYLETVLTHLSSGVLSFDGRGILRTYNAAAETILGAALAPVAGKSLSALSLHCPDLVSFVDAVKRGIGEPAGEWQAEVVLHGGTTSPRTLLLRGTRLPRALPAKRPRSSPAAASAKGRGGHVVVFDDITALIQAQRDAAWREVARRMAHEIKNPLTPIQLSAERVRHKYLALLPEGERETLERATRTIVEQVESLKTLVNAFSDYARAEALHPTAVNLNDLVRDVVEMYRAERTGEPLGVLVPLRAAAASPPVALELDLDPQLPVIAADAGRLRQVLHNLLINARDALAATPRPRIRIVTRAVDAGGGQTGVELRVQDNGPGFDGALLERLFEPYVTSKEKGTGLGLAIVKRIVEEHGGTVLAENLAEGGACVTVRLPAARDSARATADERRAAAAGGARGSSVRAARRRSQVRA